MNSLGLASAGMATAHPRVAGLGHVAGAATALAAAGGVACWLGLKAAAAPLGALDAALCIAPALLTAALGVTSQADRHQYVARVLTAALMLPLLLMMWASSHDIVLPQWALITAVFGFIVLHALGFAALIWRLAASTTRVEPAPGSARVDAATLGQRLQALLASDLPWRLSRGSAAHEWCIDGLLPDAEQRFHRVLLNIDERGREVQVRERLGALGAAPQDAAETSLRTVGEEAFDPARPQAQKVWSRTFQATMIRPERLAQLRLHLLGSHAQADAAAVAAATEPEAMLTLLAALVTRSGYAWQPVMALRAGPSAG